MPAVAHPLSPHERPDAGADLVLLRFDPARDLVIARPGVATTRADSSGRLSLVVHEPDGLAIEHKSVAPWRGEPIADAGRCYGKPPRDVQPHEPRYPPRATRPQWDRSVDTAGAARR